MKKQLMKKQFMKKRHKILLILLILFLVFSFWQNNDLTTTKYTYSSEKITTEMDGYKIVQISDLHNKRFGKNQTRLLKAVSKENPDIIVVTGDLAEPGHTDHAMDFMEGAAKIAPVYYVTGNHENWMTDDEKQKLMKSLSEKGIIILENETKEISCGTESFLIAGLADENLGDDTLHNLLEETNKEFVLVLAHEPQYLERYSREKVDLVLTGHAHGGQFRIPFVGGLIAPDQGFFPKYTSGRHEMSDTVMFISRGLGNSVIPVRVFNRPEIVSIELRKNSAFISDMDGLEIRDFEEPLFLPVWIVEEGTEDKTRTAEYESREALLAEFGFENSAPVYQYYDRHNNLQLELYRNEPSGQFCGIAYEYYFNSQKEKCAKLYGFAGNTVLKEKWKGEDAYSKIYEGKPDEQDLVKDYNEIMEYTPAGKPDYFLSQGLLEDASENSEPEKLIEIKYVYRDDGTLFYRSYNHNPKVFGTTLCVLDSYYDEKECVIYERGYTTHGYLEDYYIYEAKEDTPAYLLELDYSHGYAYPCMVEYQ